jgi:hypothetical protein
MKTAMPVDIEGLGSVTPSAPARENIRVREAAVTLSAWRIDIASPRGPGWIVLAEHQSAWYRGDGVFLGWPQPRLEAAWRALLPPPEKSDLDFPQLG